MNIATPFGVMWMALDQHLKIQVSSLILQINRQQRNKLQLIMEWLATKEQDTIKTFG